MSTWNSDGSFGGDGSPLKRPAVCDSGMPFIPGSVYVADGSSGSTTFPEKATSAFTSVMCVSAR